VPREVGRGATFRYALSMPKLVIKAQQRGAKAPRLGEPTRGLTSAFWRGAGLGARLALNDAPLSLVPRMNLRPSDRAIRALAP
jgi:hypothetical protein